MGSHALSAVPFRTHLKRSPTAEINTQGPVARDVTSGGRSFARSRSDTVTGTVLVSLPHIFRALVATSLLLEVFTRGMVL